MQKKEKSANRSSSAQSEYRSNRQRILAQHGASLGNIPEAEGAMANNPVAQVLHEVENVTEITNGWTARCPAHSDNVNSLSIAEGIDGRALIYCHAGCSFSEIVSALGVRVRDLFVRKGGAK